MNAVFAILKFAAFVVLCLVAVPLQALVMIFTRGPGAYILPRLWHKAACAIFGIRIQKHGQPYTRSQVIYMSNHMSYLDIPVLGSIIPNASFVSKNDVAKWPVWGYLSTLQQTAFISRSRHDTKKESHALDTMLDHGKNLIIFPEGTTGNGRDILPFKSSLFALTLKDGLDDLVLQPVSVVLSAINGTQEDACRAYAWPKEDERALHEHLWDMARTSGVKIDVTFHPVIQTNTYSDRKTLAKACHDAVCNGGALQNAA